MYLPPKSSNFLNLLVMTEIIIYILFLGLMQWRLKLVQGEALPLPWSWEVTCQNVDRVLPGKVVWLAGGPGCHPTASADNVIYGAAWATLYQHDLWTGWRLSPAMLAAPTRLTPPQQVSWTPRPRRASWLAVLSVLPHRAAGRSKHGSLGQDGGKLGPGLSWICPTCHCFADFHWYPFTAINHNWVKWLSWVLWVLVQNHWTFR